MTTEELAAHPSYPELLARFLQLEQRVNDLTAQLAQHEASTLAHTSLRTLGYVVLDGLDTPDYDVNAQTDAPITDDAQADACETLAPRPNHDAGLTDAARERIWRNVRDALDKPTDCWPEWLNHIFDDDAPDAFERLSAADSVGGA